LLSFICALNATFPVNGIKTFGTAIKNGHVYQSEETIFSFDNQYGGLVTEMWFTSTISLAQTYVSIYIDGETVPSISFQLTMAHGIGFGDDDTFQGNEWLGKNAHNGGLYNTYRIPFGKSIKITARQTPSVPQVFWFIIRGIACTIPTCSTPVIIGDLQLPKNARLRLFKNLNISVDAFKYTTLAKVNNKAGLLFMVTVEAKSKDLNFLEACFRAYIDGASTPQFLSSGTEDFFLSAFYYNGGKYATSQSGLTHFVYNKDTKLQELSMYKTFIRDPVLFTTQFSLEWRDEEDNACPSRWPVERKKVDRSKDAPEIAPMIYSSYVWIYEW